MATKHAHVVSALMISQVFYILLAARPSQHTDSWLHVLTLTDVAVMPLTIIQVQQWQRSQRQASACLLLLLLAPPACLHDMSAVF